MKSLLTLAAIVVASLLTAQTPVNIAQATFEAEVYDFGTIDKGAQGTHAFILTNTGDSALVISKCEKTCGCTIPKCNPAPIAPGKSSQVVVTYDTERVGPFNKTVKVHTNDPDRPVIHLRIKGTVAA
ncbi:MAG: DUF1573 domain-containing protein [Flavobacteriales bacterium]